MDMYKLTLAVAWATLAGCAASVTPLLPAGRMNVAAPVLAPCSPGHRGAQSCEDARFNGTVISQIHKGQTETEVRNIMRHDAERLETAGSTESWGYLTSYKNQMVTWITFTDRTVSSLSHEIVGGH